MRKLYVDNIRWITVVLVVFYHVIYMFNGVEMEGVLGPFSDRIQYQDMFQYIVYPWFMALLFVISGMSSRYYLEKHTHREFIRSRTTKLLVPSTIGLLVFQWITGYYNMQFSHAFEKMGMSPKPVLYLIMCVSGTGVLWYIQLLWFFSLLLILIRKVEKDHFYQLCKRVNVVVLLLLTFVIWGAAQILNTPVIVVYRIGIYGVAFLIGYFIFSHDEVVDRLSKYWSILTIAAVALMISFCVVYWQKPYAHHEVLDTLLCNVYTWIAVLAILAVMNRFGNFDNAFCSFMKKESWGLYIFHYMPLAACTWYLHLYQPALEMPAVFMYILVAVAAFAGSYILNAVISRIPFVRWCVLGIKGKRK